MQRFMKTVKNDIYLDKNNLYGFLIFAENIEVGYTLEPYHGGVTDENMKKMYTTVHQRFTIQKWGVRGLNYTDMLAWYQWYYHCHLSALLNNADSLPKFTLLDVNRRKDVK